MLTSRLAVIVVAVSFLLLTIAGSAGAGVSARKHPFQGGEVTPDRPSPAQDSLQVENYLPLVLHPAPTIHTSAAPKINAPQFEGDIPFDEMAIFWFGKVNPTDNYTDVRVGYNREKLIVHIAVIDRLLWYDTTPSPQDLVAWDSASLFLDTSGNTGSALGVSTYRFDGQINWNQQDRTGYQASYKGSGSNWTNAEVPFTTTTAYRGNPLDLNRDSGWRITYEIPFSSLGLSGPPAEGSDWGLGVLVYDRDGEESSPVLEKSWPVALHSARPASWGKMAFGLLAYSAPETDPTGSITIRHKLNGASVKDGEVGGGTDCASGLDFFAEWGEANYAGVDRFNIQNQWDVADWPCFSKFYITFPLEGVPAGKAILSAELTLYQFGSSGGGDFGDAPPSLIQISTVNEDWDEATLTWNNAPLAAENVSQAWVDWVDPSSPIQWPGYARTWDVSRAVAGAHASGKPLRLVLYSADSAMHSGKYFTSSDTQDWNQTGRPTLNITWGEP
jgi:hypothetical protein